MNVKLIFDFLEQLGNNNNKEWMKSNRDFYLEAKGHMLEMVSEILKGVSIFDEDVRGKKPEELLFRINRDIRFSRDKTIYKSHLGAYFSLGKKNSGHAGYYLHVEPGDKSILAGGIYDINTKTLANIRKSLSADSSEFLSIINNKDFKREYGQLEGDKLKVPPRGYYKDDPNIELIKYKYYVVSRELSDRELLRSNTIVSHIVNSFKVLMPFKKYLDSYYEI